MPNPANGVWATTLQKLVKSRKPLLLLGWLRPRQFAILATAQSIGRRTTNPLILATRYLPNYLGKGLLIVAPLEIVRRPNYGFPFDDHSLPVCFIRHQHFGLFTGLATGSHNVETIGTNIVHPEFTIVVRNELFQASAEPFAFSSTVVM